MLYLHWSFPLFLLHHKQKCMQHKWLVTIINPCPPATQQHHQAFSKLFLQCLSVCMFMPRKLFYLGFPNLLFCIYCKICKKRSKAFPFFENLIEVYSTQQALMQEDRGPHIKKYTSLASRRNSQVRTKKRNTDFFFPGLSVWTMKWFHFNAKKLCSLNTKS